MRAILFALLLAVVLTGRQGKDKMLRDEQDEEKLVQITITVPKSVAYQYVPMIEEQGINVEVRDVTNSSVATQTRGFCDNCDKMGSPSAIKNCKTLCSPKATTNDLY